MKTVLIATAWLVLLVQAAGAVVVSNTNILLGDGSDLGADFRLTVFQDEGATDGTSVWFDLSGGVMRFVTSNIDEASDWYLAEFMDEFSETNIIGGEFPVLVMTTASGFLSGDLTVGSDFYLGVNTGNDEAPWTDLPPRNVFGWVHLRNTFGTLSILDSAVGYQGSGIVVGTTQAIPEPAAVGLLVLSLLALQGRQRTVRSGGLL